MNLDGFDKLSSDGTELLTENEPVSAHSSFESWVTGVADWLTKNYPNTGLSAEWSSKGHSRLVVSNGYYDDDQTWNAFKETVQVRLIWLSQLPNRINLLTKTKPDSVQENALAVGRKEIKLQITSRAYVDPVRINELKSLEKKQHDFSKLIRLCEEINICFAGECYLSVAMLTRAILDHVPPIFGLKTFNELSNHYGNGGKSFKDQMQFLENSSRKIADSFLHMPIRSSETLPTVTQIDFSNSLDTLLGEIVRILK